jgi:hypothetical protein
MGFLKFHSSGIFQHELLQLPVDSLEISLDDLLDGFDGKVIILARLQILAGTFAVPEMIFKADLEFPRLDVLFGQGEVAIPERIQLA